MRLYALDCEWAAAEDREELARILSKMVSEEEALESAEAAHEYGDDEVLRFGSDDVEAWQVPPSARFEISEQPAFKVESVSTAREWAAFIAKRHPEPTTDRIFYTTEC